MADKPKPRLLIRKEFTAKDYVGGKEYLKPKTESKFSSMFTGSTGNILGIPPAYQTAIKDEIEKQSRFGQITQAVDTNELPYTPLKLIDDEVISSPEKTSSALGLIDTAGKEITKQKLGRFSSMVNEGVRQNVPSLMNLTDYTPPSDVKHSFLGTEQDVVKPKQPGIVPAIQDNLKGTKETLVPEINPIAATKLFPLIQDIVKKRIEEGKPIDDIPYTDETKLRQLSKKIGGVELHDPNLIEYLNAAPYGSLNSFIAGPTLTMGWISHLPAKLIGEVTGQEADVKNNPIYRAGEWMSDLWSPRKDMNSTFGYQLLQGYGSLAGFVAGNLMTSGAIGGVKAVTSMNKLGGLKLDKIARLFAEDLFPTGSKITAYSKYLTAAMKDPKFATMIQGGFATSGPEFKQAYDSTNDYYKAMGVGLASLGYGATEVIPIDRFFERMTMLNPKKHIGQIFKQAFAQGLEEGTQETVQQIGSNWTASEIYDASRPLFEGVVQGGAIGFITGFTLPILGGAVKLALQRKDVKPEDIEKAEKLMQEINTVQMQEAEKVPEIEATIPEGLPEKMETEHKKKLKALMEDKAGIEDLLGESGDKVMGDPPIKTADAKSAQVTKEENKSGEQDIPKPELGNEGEQGLEGQTDVKRDDTKGELDLPTYGKKGEEIPPVETGNDEINKLAAEEKIIVPAYDDNRSEIINTEKTADGIKYRVKSKKTSKETEIQLLKDNSGNTWGFVTEGDFKGRLMPVKKEGMSGKPAFEQGEGNMTFGKTATIENVKETINDENFINNHPDYVEAEQNITKDITNIPKAEEKANTEQKKKETGDTKSIGKEPWEMTREEFEDANYNGEDVTGWNNSPDKVQADKLLKEAQILSKSKKKEVKAKGEELETASQLIADTFYEANSHDKQIQKAISEGKTVPEEVLKDYPELKTLPEGKPPQKTEKRESSMPVTTQERSNEAGVEDKGKALFTEEENKDFEKYNIDVSGVTEKYKTEALQQLGFQKEQEAKLKDPDYNKNIQAEYDKTEKNRLISDLRLNSASGLRDNIEKEYGKKIEDFTIKELKDLKKKQTSEPKTSGDKPDIAENLQKEGLDSGKQGAKVEKTTEEKKKIEDIADRIVEHSKPKKTDISFKEQKVNLLEQFEKIIDVIAETKLGKKGTELARKNVKNNEFAELEKLVPGSNSSDFKDKYGQSSLRKQQNYYNEIIDKLKEAGFRFTNDGIGKSIEIDILGDGKVTFHPMNTIGVYEQIKKKYPTSNTVPAQGSITKKAPDRKQSPYEVAKSYKDFQKSEDELEVAKENLKEAETNGNEQLVELMKKNLQEAEAIHTAAKNFDYAKRDKEELERRKSQREQEAIDTEYKTYVAGRSGSIYGSAQQYLRAKAMNLIKEKQAFTEKEMDLADYIMKYYDGDMDKFRADVKEKHPDYFTKAGLPSAKLYQNKAPYLAQLYRILLWQSYKPGSNRKFETTEHKSVVQAVQRIIELSSGIKKNAEENNNLIVLTGKETIADLKQLLIDKGAFWSESQPISDFYLRNDKKADLLKKVKIYNEGIKQGDIGLISTDNNKATSKVYNEIKGYGRGVIEELGLPLDDYDFTQKHKDVIEKANEKWMQFGKSKDGFINSDEVPEAKTALRKIYEELKKEIEAIDKPAEPVKVKAEEKPIEDKEKLEDFGEKIGGARKDEVKKYFDKINLNGKILSVIFPKPDIKALLDSGLSVKDVAGIKVAHEFARVDKKKGERVIKFYAAYAKNILAESINLEYKNEGYTFTDYGKSQIELRTKAYRAVHKELGADFLALDLTKARIKEPDKDGNTTYFENGKPVKDVNYIVSYYVSRIKYHTNLEAAINDFVEQVRANTKTDAVEYKHKLSVYQDRRNSKDGYYIAFAPKGKELIKLREGIKTTKEAFEILKDAEALAEMHLQLERILAENKEQTKKTVTRLKYTNETARERTGKDWRNGKDVGPKELAETFGFRAIEFGNWVNQKERQVFINNSYDSLMDLAQLLNISPKAISLAGNLGITFGSRGSGNASAHFEPERRIINLTKTKGLGSLAHEWWHAVDNYFTDFKTTGKGMQAASNLEFKAGVREEIKTAFNKLYTAVNTGDMKKRSNNLDSSRNRNYFSLPHEMSARAFENYILKRLNESGQVNDFIVNYISNDDWNGETDKYPFPTGEEAVKINDAFQELIDTFETEEKDGKTPIFARVETLPVNEVPELQKRLVKRLLKAFPGMTEKDVVIAANTEEFLNTLRDEEGYDARELDFAKKEVSPTNKSIELPETIKINGKDLPTRNSDGNFIADTEAKVKNFWEFYGGSVVVDEQDRPIVMKHGTRFDFNEFDKKDIGYHFGTDEQANNRIGIEKGYIPNMPYAGQNIMPVYLSIKNPIEMKDVGEWGSVPAILDELKNIPEFKDEALEWIKDFESGDDVTDIDDIKYLIKEKGFDGIKYRNTFESDKISFISNPLERAKVKSELEKNGDYSYIVFDKNQIKSSTGNNGNFDKINDDIRFAKGKNNVMPVAYVGSDGRIHLDGSKITGEFPIHEFGHIWARWARINAPSLLTQGFKLVEMDTDLMDEAKRLYPDVSRERLYEEGLMMAIGRKGEGMYENILNESKKRNLIEKFKRWMKNLFDRIFGVEKTFDEWVDARVKDLFYGKFEGMSSSGTGSSSKSVGQGIAAVKKEVKPVFYSGLEKVAMEKLPNKMAPEQVKSTLLNNGVKQAEYDWMGLDEFMQGKKSIDKKDLMDFIASNKVEMREVVKGDMKPSATKDNIGKVEFSQHGRGQYLVHYKIGEDSGIVEIGTDIADNEEEAISEAIKRINHSESDYVRQETKFEQWKTEGGENYREVMLMLPVKKEPWQHITYEWINEKELPGYIERGWEATGKTSPFPTMKEKIEIKFVNETIQYSEDTFKSSHFDEPNIALHLRLQDFVDMGSRSGASGNDKGKKILLIDEVQSDWAQKGRKEGYKSDISKVFKREIITKEDVSGEKLTDYHVSVFPNTEKELFYTVPKKDVKNIEEAKEYIVKKYNEETKVINERQISEHNNNAVPDMPFKKNWQEVGMKWALRYAAENGYDAIAWTTGEQQAERYDLSKQVDEIRYLKNDWAGWGKPDYEIRAVKDGEVVLSKNNLTEKALEDLLGKDITKKIINDEGKEPERGSGNYHKTLSGIDLKVGDSGMKGFYDKILPDFMNKYAKKWGGKVGSTELGTKENINISEEIKKLLPKKKDTQTFHSLDITPSMRASVMFEGQPMFVRSKGENALLTKGEADGLELAKRMEKAGRDGKEIAERTGWKKGLYNSEFRMQSSELKDKSDSPQIAQIDTNNFKKWFGDWKNNPENSSKVVIENKYAKNYGEPLPVMHYSPVANIRVFDTPSFFMDSDEAYRNEEIRPYGYEVYLNIKTPLDLRETNIGKEQFLKLYKDILEYSKVTDIEKRLKFANKHTDNYGFFKLLDSGGIMGSYSWDWVTNYARDKGYDGVIIRDSDETASYYLDSYIPLDPGQIKSAKENNGDFDINNNDIRFARIKTENEGDWFEDENTREELDKIGRMILERFPDITDEKFMEKMNLVLSRVELRVTEEQSGVILRGVQSKELRVKNEEQETSTAKKNEDTEQNLGKEQESSSTGSGSKEQEKSKSADDVKKKVIPPGMDERRFNVQVQRDKEFGKTEKEIIDKESLYTITSNKQAHAEAEAMIEQLGGDDAAYTALIERDGLWRAFRGKSSEVLDGVPGYVKTVMLQILIRRKQDIVNQSGITAEEILKGNADIKAEQALNQSLELTKNLMFKGTESGLTVQSFSVFGRLSRTGALLYAKRMERDVNRKKQKLTEQDVEEVVRQLRKENAKVIEDLIKKYDDRFKKLVEGIKWRKGDTELDPEQLKKEITKEVEKAVKEYKQALVDYKQELEDLGYEKDADTSKLMKEIEDLTNKLDEAGQKQSELETIIKALQKKIKELEAGIKKKSPPKKSKKQGKNNAEEMTEEEKQDKRLSDAAAKLAKKIADTFEKKTVDEEKALIRQMVKTLYGVAVEKKMVDVEETEPEKMILQIGRAIKSEQDYKEVWNRSKDLTKEKLKNLFTDNEEGFEAAINRLDDYINHNLQDAFTEKQVMRAVRDAIKESGIKIQDIIRKHYTEQRRTADDLADKLIKEAGLTWEEGQGLAREVQKQMEELTAKAKAKALERYVTKQERITKNRKAIYRNLIEASNMGYLTNKDAFEILKRKYDWTTLTSVDALRIQNYADEIQAMPEGSIQQIMKIAEMMNYIKNALGFKWSELHWSLMYANQLSGIFTHVKNVKYNLMNQALEMIARNPKEFRAAMIGAFEGLSKEGILEFKFAMKHGTAGMGSKFETDEVMAQSITERYNWEDVKNNPAKWGLIYAKYVMRALYAEDRWSFAGFKEMETRALADEIARDELETDSKLQGLTRNEKQKYISARILQITNRTDIAVNAAKEQATTEGLAENSLIWQKRVYQILEQGRDPEIVRQTHKFAARGTLNYDPDGFIGGIYRMFEYYRGQPGGKMSIYILPYLRIVANVINNNLDYTPLGYKRALRGKTGDELKWSPREKRAETIRATIGTTAFIALAGLGYMFLGGDDDEDRMFDITATGTGNYDRNKQLEDGIGWKPYSIYIKGKGWFSYLDTPIQFALTAVGVWRDRQKYQSDKMDEGTIANLSYMGIMLFSSTVSQSFMQGAKDFIGAFDEKDPDKAKRYLTKLGAGIVTSYTIPNFIRQITRIINTDQYEAENVGQVWLRSWGIAQSSLGLKPRINVLGDPVKGDPTMLHSEEKKDRVWDVIIDNGAWISTPKEETLIYDPNIEDPKTGIKGMDRVMTQDEFYAYTKQRGELIRKGIDNGYDEIVKIEDKDKIRNYIKALALTAGKVTKEKMVFKESADTKDGLNQIQNFGKWVNQKNMVSRIDELAKKYKLVTKQGNEWRYRLEQETEKSKGQSEEASFEIDWKRVEKLAKGNEGDVNGFYGELEKVKR